MGRLSISKTRNSIAIGAVIFGAEPATKAFAHHPGGPGNTGGAGPIITIPATTFDQGHGAAGVMLEYTWLGGLSDQELIEAASQHEHAHSIATIASPAFSFAYGLTNNVTLSVYLPYVVRTDIREGHHEHNGGTVENTVDARGNSEGVGDLSLLGQWRFLNDRRSRTEAALLFGMKAPTGDTDETDREGVLFEAEFQPGSGSWDGALGLAATQRVGTWSFDANVLYTLVTEGDQDTDLGDRFHYNFAVSYRVVGAPSVGGPMFAGAHVHGHADHQEHDHDHAHTGGTAIDLVLELNGEWHDKQDVAGTTDDNSGGNVLYVAPGARLTKDNWSGYVSVGLPVIDNLNGLQSEPDVRLVTGASLGF